MSALRVSVCIGAFNRERYVREAVDSALAQTLAPFEVIVVDDASTDRTVEILESYGDRIRLIRRDRNSGVCSVTRNQAARAARGDFVAFLDSDDAWYPSKLEKQVAFMVEHPEVPLSHTYCHLMDEDSNVYSVRHERALPPTGRCFERLIRVCFITISTVMVRRAIFDEVGWFDEDPVVGACGEDYDFFLRVARRHPIGLVDDVLGRFRKSPAGITAPQWRAMPRAVPIHRVILKRRSIWEGMLPRRAVVDALTEACLENSQYWRDRGFFSRALYFAAMAGVHDPFNADVWASGLKAGIVPLRKLSGVR
jgi:glycosyltransferase involved in cell wall biosynthesis